MKIDMVKTLIKEQVGFRETTTLETTLQSAVKSGITCTFSLSRCVHSPYSLLCICECVCVCVCVHNDKYKICPTDPRWQRTAIFKKGKK